MLIVGTPIATQVSRNVDGGNLSLPLHSISYTPSKTDINPSISWVNPPPSDGYHKVLL